jgi:hypothetical protein
MIIVPFAMPKQILNDCLQPNDHPVLPFLAFEYLNMGLA